MTPPPYLYHALLRPSILQILRAAGYHGARTSVLDSVTDMAARYLDALCRLTAAFAAHNNEESQTGELVPTIVDVRMALQQIGALLPEKSELEQMYNSVEDTRGVDAFVAWAAGPVNREIKRIALDGSDEATDYLNGEFMFIFRLVCYENLLRSANNPHFPPSSSQTKTQQKRR